MLGELRPDAHVARLEAENARLRARRVPIAETAALEAENTRLRAWVEEASRALQSATIIGERSCRPGDGLNYGWHDRLIAAAAALGTPDATETARERVERGDGPGYPALGTQHEETPT